MLWGLLPLAAHAQPSKTPEVLSDSVRQALCLEKPYSTYLELEDNHLVLSRLRRWLQTFFTHLFENKVSNGLANLLPYLIILAVLVLIILKLGGLSLTQMLKPAGKSIATALHYTEDAPIQETNFQALLQAAMAQGDYRTAIRFSYLQLLQILDQKQYIVWTKPKTNYDYYLSLQQQAFGANFKELTRIFENAWYGESPWTTEEYKAQYNLLQNQIETIKQHMQA